jgi:hypothetical protein
MNRIRISLTREKIKNKGHDAGAVERANTRFAPTRARKPGPGERFEDIYKPIQHHQGGAQ